MTAKINILISNERGYVWDMRDVQKLRVQHHICGVLSGTLPQVGQQNVFLGLPLMLLPEEVVLLVKNEIAVLVDDIAAHKKATKEQAAAYHAHREAAILSQQTQQRKHDEEKRARMAEVHKEKIEAARLEKQKAREAKRQAALEAGTLFEVVVPDLNGETTEPPPSTRNPASATVKAQPPVSSLPYTIIIQPSSLDMPWYDPASATYETLDAAKEAGLYHYPSTSTQKARCKVFEDLWRKGHFMGGGLRFGGDFLVYPGDPLRYHSHFTLTVFASPTSTIMPLDLVAYGRLATAVKKAHLLASWDEKAEKAEYFSLEWAAFG